MKAYFLALLAIALTVTVIGILAPSGERGGISKHVGLLSGLCLICVLIAPLNGLSEKLGELLEANLKLPAEENASPEDSSAATQELLDSVGNEYFTAMLTQALETEFAITPGEVRCVTVWETANGRVTPQKVTVVLSGRAIWKDTGAIEAYVSRLLGCPCESAIE